MLLVALRAMCLVLVWLFSGCVASPLPKVTVVTVNERPTPAPGIRFIDIQGQVQGPLPALVEVERFPFQTQTDAQGNFSLAQVPADAEYLHIYSTQADGQRYARRVPVHASQANLNVTPVELVPTGDVVGIVQGTGDLTGTAVFIAGTALGARCDAEGNFFLPQVPAGQYTLTALREGFKPVNTQIQVEAGQAVPVVLMLSEASMPQTGFQIRGQVLASEEPIAGAMVAVLGHSRVALTDHQGRFYLGTLPEGEYQLLVTREGFASRTQALHVQAEQVLSLNLTALYTKGVLQGRVLDESGKPQAVVSVFLEPGAHRILTDQDGFFETELLPGVYAMHARKNGQLLASGFTSIAAEQTSTVTLQEVMSLSSLLCHQRNENQINIHAPGSQVTVNIENSNHCQF